MPKGLNPKHTACRPGKLVLIKPIHGQPFTDIFIERRHGVIYLKRYGKITKEEIRSFRVVPKHANEKDA